jgi:hypothetical protein
MLDCCTRAIKHYTDTLKDNSKDEDDFELVHHDLSLQPSTVDVFSLFESLDTSVVNGVLNYLWSLSSKNCVDLIIALRNKHIALHWNRELPLDCMLWLRRNHPVEYISCIEQFIKVGYYKDLLLILDNLKSEDPILGVSEFLELEIFAETLCKDYDTLCELRSNPEVPQEHKITMCAKWAPSENKQWHEYAIKISRLANPGTRRHREFYRDILSRLRKYLSFNIAEHQEPNTMCKFTIPYGSLVKYYGSFVSNDNWTKTDEDMLTSKVIKKLCIGYDVNTEYIRYIFEILKHNTDSKLYCNFEKDKIILSSITANDVMKKDMRDVKLKISGDFTCANLKLLFVIYYICICIWSNATTNLVTQSQTVNEIIKAIISKSSNQDDECKEVNIEVSNKDYTYIWYPLRRIKITHDIVQGIHPLIFNSILNTSKPPKDFIDSLQMMIEN